MITESPGLSCSASCDDWPCGYTDPTVRVTAAVDAWADDSVLNRDTFLVAFGFGLPAAWDETVALRCREAEILRDQLTVLLGVKP